MTVEYFATLLGVCYCCVAVILALISSLSALVIIGVSIPISILLAIFFGYLDAIAIKGR